MTFILLCWPFIIKLFKLYRAAVKAAEDHEITPEEWQELSGQIKELIETAARRGQT